MMRKCCISLLVVSLSLQMVKAQTAAGFADPPVEYRPVPLWFWNNTRIDRDEALRQFGCMTGKDLYGGCAILPFGSRFSPEYLSEEYFSLYGDLIKSAAESGASVVLYDEYGFPSGSMGAINGDSVPRFMEKYPDATVKRLDKLEYTPDQDGMCSFSLPDKGKVMSLVAMDTVSGEIVPVSFDIGTGSVEWKAPGPQWKVMCFICVTDGDPNVDYLDPEAVGLFISETHQKYFEHFPEAFGTVIKGTFFDEPTLYRAQGRIWTCKFNEKFEQEYGFSPELLYPALWYDIGPSTAAARNLLFGFRARLYAEGFMKTIRDWSAEHGIYSTGHQDQEEVLNPVSVSGDLMLCGKYMDIPGIDKIGGGRPTEGFYKVVSSSAANWDKASVMSETYGAMGNIPVNEMYSIAMDQYTKGIDRLVPHAVWYNDSDVTFLPELSWRNPLYSRDIPDFNMFLSRLNYMLQRKGRTVSDIAVLYPVSSLQAAHHFDGPEGYYNGGVRIPGTDYIHIGMILTDTLSRDFTFIHPEVLENRCNVYGGKLNLDNENNHQHYSVLIVPGMRCISVESLEKIEEFRRAGGKVIFTTCLPECSSTFTSGRDRTADKVREMTVAGRNPAVFIEHPSPDLISEVLDGSYVPDVAVSGISGLKYIHRISGGRHVFYFANTSDSLMAGQLLLRDRLELEAFDPHTGKTWNIECSGFGDGTQVEFSLPSRHSVFLVSSE